MTDDAPDLDRTDDESEWRRPATNPGRKPSSNPHLRPPTDTGRVRKVDPADMAPSQMAEWEVFRAINARIDAVAERVDAHESTISSVRKFLTAIAKSIRNRTWGALAGLLAAVAFVLKLTYAAGQAQRDASAQIRAVETNTRTINALRDSLESLYRNVARIEGELYRISPIGSVPIVGPPNRNQIREPQP